MSELGVPIRCRGLLLKIIVRPGRSQEQHGLAAKPSCVATRPLSAYLDTGASGTMLDLGIVETMGLEPVESTAVHVLGREEVSYHEVYHVDVAIVVTEEPPRWIPLFVLGGAVFSTGAVAALGRDFLRHVVFTYDGPAGQATLRW